ncbi:UNVERIFIED_CONTAM: hypothetical protein FKN15_054024 [Acipenser sinensis]
MAKQNLGEYQRESLCQQCNDIGGKLDSAVLCNVKSWIALQKLIGVLNWDIFCDVLYLRNKDLHTHALRFVYTEVMVTLQFSKGRNIHHSKTIQMALDPTAHNGPGLASLLIA